MNNHERAVAMYRDIQRRKKLKEEGKKQADKYLTEMACNSINKSARWKNRNPKGRRRCD